MKNPLCSTCRLLHLAALPIELSLRCWLSGGTLVAAQLALEEPERIDRIIMIDMRFFGEAFRAAFSYDHIEAFAKIKVPAKVIATNAILFNETKLAAKASPGAQLVDLPEIKKAVLDAGAELLASTVLNLD